MRVFISWSGAQSRAIARSLSNWLSDVMQNIEPWMSAEDIRMGSRWNIDIAKMLETSQFGILCLTRENLKQPWILFEAGALSKTLERAHVCPYLIDLTPSELEGPLVQFQAACANKEDTRQLVHSINDAMGADSREKSQIDRTFEKWWPDLKEEIGAILAIQTNTSNLRSDRDLLEEILYRIREEEVNRKIGERISRVIEWGVPSDGLFSGQDINELRERLAGVGAATDPNATIWRRRDFSELDISKLNGQWSSRWSGGTAEDEWVDGVAQIIEFKDFVYMIHHDGRADCFIATKKVDQNHLIGRYINLASPQEVLPWVGLIVDNLRIDGWWLDGRWDLRRAENKNTAA